MNQNIAFKYADRQMERKAEVQKQLVAAGNVRQRIPADTQRFAPGVDQRILTPTPTKVKHSDPKSAFMFLDAGV